MNELRIAVSDEGIGVAEQDRNRIFAKFFRVNRKEARTVPGTGLGLAIVKSIIDRHGGKISVADHTGGGTTFSICIPTTVRRPQISGELRPVARSRAGVGSRRTFPVAE